MKAMPSSLEKPRHLMGRVGGVAWDRAVAECIALKIDPEQRYDVLERYAVTYQLWFECQKRVRKEGQAITHKRGRTVEIERNPRMTDYHRLTEILGRIRGELGLSPLTKRKAD